MFVVNKNPSTNDLTKFGRAMLIGFAVLAAIVWLLAWKRGVIPTLLGWNGAGAQVAAVVLFGVGLALWLISLASAGTTRTIYIAWMTVTVPIGVVMTTLLLTVLFGLLLPIFSLIVRRGDPIRRRLSPGGTYWEPYKRHEPTLDRVRRPF